MSQWIPPAITFPEKTLTRTALANPSSIDDLLTTHLFTSAPTIPIDTFAAYLSDLLAATTHIINGTPPIHWANPSDYDKEDDFLTRRYRDPTLTPTDLFTIRTHATLLGRAIALSYAHSNSQPKRVEPELWHIAESLFHRALFVGGGNRDADPGVRYATAIVILSCGETLARDATIEGQGKGWCLWGGPFEEPDAVWGWEDVRAGIFATEELPRTNTDFRVMLVRFWEEYAPPGYDTKGNFVGVGNEGRSGVGIGAGDGEEGRRGRPVYEIESRSATDIVERGPVRSVVFPEFVQKEVLEAFDLARERLREGKGDLGPGDVVDIFGGS